MIKVLFYVTSGLGVFVTLVLLYLFLRTLYRLVFDIYIPQKVIVMNSSPCTKPPNKED